LCNKNLFIHFVLHADIAHFKNISFSKQLIRLKK
jgi:hypothetical protein